MNSVASSVSMSKYQIQRKPAPYVSSPPFLVLGGRRIQSHPENRKSLLVRHRNGYDKILLTTYLTHQMVWRVVAVLRPHEYKSGGPCELACPSLGQNLYWYNVMIYKALALLFWMTCCYARCSASQRAHISHSVFSLPLT